MNITGFEKAKERSDAVQAQTEGEVVTNPLGTNGVASPIEGNDHIEQFNKGVGVMTKMGDYSI